MGLWGDILKFLRVGMYGESAVKMTGYNIWKILMNIICGFLFAYDVIQLMLNS